MGANFSRFFVESPGNTILASHYNGEFDNILTNFTPQGMDDYSDNTAQSRNQTDPGSFATPSLATSLAGELERLRFRIASIIGGSNNSWLDTPPTTLSILSQPSAGLSIGLEFEGPNGGSSDTEGVLAQLINQGTIINAASLISADVTTSSFDSTDVKFGNYSYILNGSNMLAFPGQNGNKDKRTISAWFRNLAAGDAIAYNHLAGIELRLDNTGLLTATVEESTAATESTKDQTQVQGAASRAGDATFRNVVMQYQINGEGGAGTDLINLFYEDAVEGTAVSGDTINNNAGQGGIWFYGARKNRSFTYDHFYAGDDTPDNHSSPWSVNGVPNASAVSGILNIATTGSNVGNYSRTDLSNLPGQTIEMKVKVNACDRETKTQTGFTLTVGDDSVDRSFVLALSEDGLILSERASSTLHLAEFKHNMTCYNTITVTTSGVESADTDQDIKLYLNGQLIYDGTLTTTDNSIADEIRFGDTRSTAGINCDVDIEYVAVYDGGAEAPVLASTQGNLDSIGMANSIVGSSTITSLQSSKISDVFGTLPCYGPTLPPTALFNGGDSLSFGVTNFTSIGDHVYYLAGDGVTEYEIDFLASLQSADSGTVIRTIIDVNSDASGNTHINYGGGVRGNANATNTGLPVPAKRSVVLAPGLHVLKPGISNTSGTCSITEEDSMVWQCNIRKETKLC